MREIVLDGRRMTDRAAAHEALAEALSLPGYYGRNLDALRDCLTDVAVPTRLRLTHAGAARSALGPYGDLLLRVLSEACGENPLLSLTLSDEA